MNRFSEKDWRIFRSKIARWQEAYMDKLNNEYIAILSGEEMLRKSFGSWRKELKRIKRIVVYNAK